MNERWDCMTRHRLPRRLRITASLLGITALLAAGGGGALVPAALAAGPDKAEVVLVLDYSGSILEDKATRDRFAGALERLAGRVDDTTRDLISGDTTVSMVEFASKAADVKGCTELKLLGSPSTARRFADCLRTVATAYRQGPSRAVQRRIGQDTNYVAAMQQAATHLPENSVRPTMILFTDGKHDVAGVPVSRVLPTRDQLFGDRKPFALLPVGMGLDPKDKAGLEAGLLGLRTINEVPACSSGDVMEWPQVVFDSPDEAGNAVGSALANATCTFTVEPGPSPTPPPSNAVRGVTVKPLDGKIDVTWSAPAPGAEAPTDYQVRCLADGQAPVESTEGVSLDRHVVVDGLENGTEYRCEVATVTAAGVGDYTPASTSVTPIGTPPPPAAPAVEGGNGVVKVSLAGPPDAAIIGYHFECVPLSGSGSPASVETAGGDQTSAELAVTNGTLYQCSVSATNTTGTGELSPFSAAVRPCSNFVDCNGLSLPLIGGITAIILGAIGLGLMGLARTRTGGYVVAIVDNVHSANLGGGVDIGLALVGGPYARQLDAIAAAKPKKADVRIHRLRGNRFRVHDRQGRQDAKSGEAIVVTGPNGVRHELVLRAFEGKAASPVTVRR